MEEIKEMQDPETLDKFQMISALEGYHVLGLDDQYHLIENGQIHTSFGWFPLAGHTEPIVRALFHTRRRM